MLTVSVGVCAYNEEANILRCLESISSQSLDGFDLKEIVVVSSASRDRTDEIVEGYKLSDNRVQLIVQEKREGKTSAVNLFIASASSNILVLVNADNTLRQGSLQSLLLPFNDPGVGVVGGHPVPVNSKDTAIGFAVNLLWEMHHELSLIYPKVGELIAFRNEGVAIPPGTSTDEDAIRMILERKGFRTAYAPDALVVNKGPTTIQDFWKQRVRVNIGEKYMEKRFDYKIPTWNLEFVLSALAVVLKNNRDNMGKLAIAMGLEGLIRLYAALYVFLDKGDIALWEMVQTSKDVEG